MTVANGTIVNFEGAVRKLLERDLPGEYRAEWTRHLAEQKTENTSELRSCVVFRIGSALFALPTSIVEVVAEDAAFHTIPQTRGRLPVTLANIRGELLVCVSLAALLGIEASTVDASDQRKTYRHVISCRKRDERFAFPVDEVCGVEHYRVNEMDDLPATVAGAASRCTRGLLSIADRTIAFVDAELLFETLGKSL
jgi:chemotaxis-related protein WspD